MKIPIKKLFYLGNQTKKQIIDSWEILSPVAQKTIILMLDKFDFYNELAIKESLLKNKNFEIKIKGIISKQKIKTIKEMEKKDNLNELLNKI